MQFYVMSEGKREPVGPFDVPTIVQHIENGWLRSTATICKPGDSQWLPISQVPEFSIALSRHAEPQLSEPKKATTQKPAPTWFTWIVLGGIGLGVAMCSVAMNSSREERVVQSAEKRAAREAQRLEE